MGRLILLFIEFWEIIITSVTLLPALGIFAWFSFRNYLIVQNEWISTYKPTIDVIFAIIGILIALNWLDEFKRQTTKEEQTLEENNTNVKHDAAFIVCEPNDINVRQCAIPSNSECPKIAILRSGLNIIPTGETKNYIEKIGKNTTWVKIKYKNITGWINSSYICKKNI